MVMAWQNTFTNNIQKSCSVECVGGLKKPFPLDDCTDNEWASGAQTQKGPFLWEMVSIPKRRQVSDSI